jgi:hypothetical protein
MPIWETSGRRTERVLGLPGEERPAGHQGCDNATGPAYCERCTYERSSSAILVRCRRARLVLRFLLLDPKSLIPVQDAADSMSLFDRIPRPSMTHRNRAGGRSSRGQP